MAVITKKDGRIVRKDYTRFRHEIYDHQEGLCYLCQAWWPFDNLQVHHHGERGLGGSRRNDVGFYEVHPAGQPMVRGLCYGVCVNCHNEQDKKVLFWSK